MAKQARQMDNTIEQIKAKNEELRGSSSLGATSLLTFPMYNDSARMIMFSSHINQRVVLNETEFPKVFTNFENMVGEHISYNQKAESDYKVIDVIEKFPDIETGKDIQNVLYVVYDIKNDCYDILERHDVENLTEKYGFQNDNSGINKFGKGDIIPQGEVLSRPTSYDEFGNYGFGRNVKFMYTIDQDTIEDAIVVSESLAKATGLLASTEVEEVKVPLNDNDILGNLYGDGDNYKTFPDIGEYVKDKILCVKKRIVKSQVLFDLKTSNTKKILSSDIPFYIDGIVTDIDIFFNKPFEELNMGVFNDQLIRYIQMINRFYEKVKDVTNELIDSGAKCTDNLLYWNKRVSELTNPEIKNKDDLGNVFGNIIMYFTVKRNIGVTVGQKITGRYGNKGVVSRVYPDYMMPHLETGERVDIKFNTLGVFNRLNIFQLYEQSINFITERTVHKFINENTSIPEMERIVFRILEIFNPEECRIIKETYKKDCTTNKKKEEFFDIIKRKGIYIHIKPYWHGENIYECIKKCYEEFDWIKPYKCYFYEEHSNRWVQMMQDQIVGSMYIMKLKQSSKKNMSACSNAPINNLGLPSKNDNAKKHRSLYPKTPIRSGLQETINNMISISPEISAKLHMYYRSSPVARRKLGIEIINNYGKGLPIEPIMTDKMTNRNVEILEAYLKIMGLQLVFDDDIVHLPVTEEGRKDDSAYYHRYKGNSYLATPEFMMRQIARDKVLEKMEDNEIGYIYIGEEGSFKEQLIEDLTDAIEADMIDLGPEEFLIREGDIIKY